MLLCNAQAFLQIIQAYLELVEIMNCNELHEICGHISEFLQQDTHFPSPSF